PSKMNSRVFSTMSQTQVAPSVPRVDIQSMPPQAIHREFGWNATASTEQPSAASGISRNGSRFSTSHTQQVPSVAQAEANKVEFGANVTTPTGPQWPRSWNGGLAPSQTCR